MSRVDSDCVLCGSSSRQSLKGKSGSRGGWRERGGRGRNVDTSMEFHLNKIRLQHEEYPPMREQASRQIIVLHEIEICDRLASSRINKFLHHYASSSLPRQSHSNMFLLKALHVRPDIKLPAQEVCLKVSVQPLRLNIDQDSLVFFRTFFTDVSTLCGRHLVPFFFIIHWLNLGEER
jgi:autophagy-related protein 2